MILLICKKCGKHIELNDMKEGNIVDISRCPNCNSLLDNPKKIKTTREEENIEKIDIFEIIKERQRNDNGNRFSLEEIENLLKND